MNEYLYSDIYIGMTESFTKEITKESEDFFRIITGDENPLHKNDEYARQISNGEYPSHVAFGMLTASFYSTLAGMYLPGKYSLIHSINEVSFRKPVFVGDVLTIEGNVSEKYDGLKLIILDVTVKNQKKQTVSKAKMKVLVMK